MNVLGSSPVTSVIGYAVGGLVAAQEIIHAQGLPQDTEGWLKLIGAVLFAVWGRYQKDHNVSNATVAGEAKPVQ